MMILGALSSYQPYSLGSLIYYNKPHFPTYAEVPDVQSAENSQHRILNRTFKDFLSNGVLCLRVPLRVLDSEFREFDSCLWDVARTLGP